ncbi:hypothetical protein HGM15179_002052 [Zosterops borbonicus]|uniref:Uncharacterized protein n=1 Tax=Zosterops borbonicus TaxID=364589 RepID=A0A8K1GTF8_9PASS|nr:hypothetical protein HGM15179_002052 [Zosterops borbonicus]
MAPGTWDKTVPPGVTYELLFPRGISCAPEQDGSLQAIAEQQVDPSLAIAGAQGSGELFPLEGPQPIVPMACELPGMRNWVSMPRTCFFSTSQGCHARPSGIDEGPSPHIFFALEGLCLKRHKAGFACFGNGSIRAD